MKLSNKIKKFQAGGPVEDPATAAPEAAPAAPQAAAPEAGAQEQIIAQVDQMADSVIQQLGPDVAVMLAEAIMAKLQGGAEQLPPEEEQPVYSKMGGQIRRIR